VEARVLNCSFQSITPVTVYPGKETKDPFRRYDERESKGKRRRRYKTSRFSRIQCTSWRVSNPRNFAAGVAAACAPGRVPGPAPSAPTTVPSLVRFRVRNTEYMFESLPNAVHSSLTVLVGGPKYADGLPERLSAARPLDVG
jgi:hypothetical protein